MITTIVGQIAYELYWWSSIATEELEPPEKLTINFPNLTQKEKIEIIEFLQASSKPDAYKTKLELHLLDIKEKEQSGYDAELLYEGAGAHQFILLRSRMELNTLDTKHEPTLGEIRLRRAEPVGMRRRSE